ncbi:MAG: transport between ER and Golgi ATPase protein [Vezdaea aestivalis]|nr:MAG: transport between ER and Golgi ATPase protein [Vezdaea aestivalis]
MSNPITDLSGLTSKEGGNPYDALIEASNNAAPSVQARYETHRTTRNQQQRAKLLAQDFPGVTLDPVLRRLQFPDIEPGFVDERHCLVFWARPPVKVKALIGLFQRRLLEIAPTLWLMPIDSLHMTALEMAHSKTEEEIAEMVRKMSPSIPEIVNATLKRRSRIIKPMLSYDSSAIALSFVPAAGEGLSKDRGAEDDSYTYHHLRRDLYSLCNSTGVPVQSRYVVPSSHLTVARFVTYKGFSKEPLDESNPIPDPEPMKVLIDRIEELNEWLQREFWPPEDGGLIPAGGEWIVGEEKGLDNRIGRLWYGGGITNKLGEGF